MDLTHGGIILALEIAELDIFKEIWVWDIYQTASEEQKKILQKNGIKLIDSEFKKSESLESKEDLKSFLRIKNPDFQKEDDIKIISPIHCPINIKPDFSHHQAIKLILDNSEKLKIENSDFKKNLKKKYLLNIDENSKEIPIIEVTGVKGKTSAVGMLKQIFAPYRPLILSSLGAEIFENDKSVENSGMVSESIILKKNISITPASIVETINLAENYDYGICIFETSLGATGMADVGLLTNIIEDYPIASKKSKASLAKQQIFQSKMICCEYETFHEYYGHLKYNLENRINTFSFNKSNKSNLFLTQVEYGLTKSIIEIKTHDLKTINGEILNGHFSVETFAPSPYQVENVLAAVCCALTLGMDINEIKKGLENFSGMGGRSSIRNYGDITIIEEINPGINIKAIENAIKMSMELESPAIILGGQYGITCEEIDELKAAELLEKIFYNKNINNNEDDDGVEDSNICNSFPEKNSLILTNELGLGIKEKMDYNPPHFFDPQKAIQFAIENEKKNITFIYRSNYSNIKQR
jgi:UDP-N-acetylmuramyl pentapeptide synthase